MTASPRAMHQNLLSNDVYNRVFSCLLDNPTKTVA